jgi:zinc protease
MTAGDFALTRDFLRSYMKLYTQTPSRQLGFLMDSRFYGRTDYLAEMDALLARLKVEDVNKAIRKYWQADRMFISIVTDDSEAEPLRNSLLENIPSPMSYSDALKANMPAKILEEDALVSKFPLQVKKVEVISSDSLFR